MILIIGTLLDIINEDSKSARLAKIRNIKAKDSTSERFIVYDGTVGDQVKKMKDVSTPKQFKAFIKKINDWIERNNLTRSKAYSYYTNDPGNNEKGTFVPANYEKSTGVIAIDSRHAPTSNSLCIDGTANTDSPVIKHELQHKNQFNIIKELSKGRHGRKKYREYLHKEELLRGDKNDNELELKRKYYINPLEYDANLAAIRGNISSGPGTMKAIKAAIGIGKPFKTTPGRGYNLNVYNTDGEKINSDIRKRVNELFKDKKIHSMYDLLKNIRDPEKIKEIRKEIQDIVKKSYNLDIDKI